jgi:hypothetical protein
LEHPDSDFVAGGVSYGVPHQPEEGPLVRAHRGRQERARRLRAEGKSFADIVRELETDVPVVKTWVASGKA